MPPFGSERFAGSGSCFLIRSYRYQSITNAHTFPAARHKFIFELVKAMEKEMKIAECEALQKTLTNLLKEKRKVAAQKVIANEIIQSQGSSRFCSILY